ncbi:MAG: class I SAM-dependent methyltransferase [Verrucomicrobia bacterium]|jgi:extracellular factor (EF) 3-hydroxypalmitic acid methyl ester biosynthesis protein|nr:class I SAM-dependent methyltransferase [Verrucomicrobiota bacterium]
MDDTIPRENLVTFQNSQGMDIRANLLRLSRHAATFEVYSSDLVLRTSEALQEFKIFSNERVVYSGRAVVRELVNTGTVVVCEANLDDLGFDADFLSSVARPGQLRARFDDFVREWQKVCLVRPEFKVALADIQTFLIDLRRWVEQIELGIRSSPASDRMQLEHEAVEKLSAQVVLMLDHLFAKFEEIAGTLDSESQPRHRSYAQRLLHPIVLCAPFANRTYQKPLGYAGDYEMVNMMLRDPQEGASLFAKLFNVWLLQQASAAAHRNRVQFMLERLTQESLRCLRQGRPMKVINLGCGPAGEIQKFLAAGSIADNARFTLLDFNDETINHTTRVLGDICRQNGRQTAIEVLKKSVHQVLKEGAKPGVNSPDRNYDFVCCAGLFDYLSDRTCQQLTNIFWNWTRPGGLVLTTNVTPRTPNRGSLELVLDWHLIYRDAQRFATLAPDGAPPDGVRVFSEDTGVNIFMEARKPDA